MARRKSADYHMRTDPDNRRLWQQEADERDMSLASWLEAVANAEVLKRRHERVYYQAYPQKRPGALLRASETWAGHPTRKPSEPCGCPS
jgi:hypothetical protein